MTDIETTQDRSENTRPAADRYLGWVAAAIVWILSAYRVAPSSLWASDYRVIQCLSEKAVGWDGIVTALVARVLREIPLGTVVSRIALGSALAAAVSAWLGYRIGVWVLSRTSQPKTVECWLSFGTVTLFSVGHATQKAATLPSGPLVAVALVFGILYVTLDVFSENRSAKITESRFFLLGLLVAITALENAPLAVFALVLIALLRWSFRARLTRQSFRVGFMGVAFGLFSLGLPWLSTRDKVLSQALNAGIQSEPGPFEWWHLLPSFRTSLSADLGLVLLVLALLGATLTLGSPKRRQYYWLFVLGLPPFLLLPNTDGLEGPDAFRLLGYFGLLLLSTLGLIHAIDWSARGRRSPQLLAQCLAVVLQMTLALAQSDETAYETNHYRHLGLEVFTDEAVTALPARSVVLLRDPRLYRRFYAARLTNGLRADLLLIPLEAATQNAIVADLLPREPALGPVLRELSINGRPSEYSLSSLADERPVFLEFDPNWDRRLREHLLPLPILSRLYSQALGRSDRAKVLDSSRQQLNTVFEATTPHGDGASIPESDRSRERATRAVFRARFEEQLTVLLDLGDRPIFDALLTDYEQLDPENPWIKRAKALTRTFSKTQDAFQLLRAPTEVTR